MAWFEHFARNVCSTHNKDDMIATATAALQQRRRARGNPLALPTRVLPESSVSIARSICFSLTNSHVINKALYIAHVRRFWCARGKSIAIVSHVSVPTTLPTFHDK